MFPKEEKPSSSADSKIIRGPEGVPDSRSPVPESRAFVPESKISIPESDISIPDPLKPFLSPDRCGRGHCTSGAGRAGALYLGGGRGWGAGDSIIDGMRTS